RKIEIAVEEVLVATGRGSNTDILHPEKSLINVDNKGWLIVNEYMETSQPNVWALGDADGKYLFKHVANYESKIVYYNAILKKRMKMDYHAVPHAIFTYPEMASVGFKEKEAINEFGKNNVLIGSHRYQDTAKGEAMSVKDYFVKVIFKKDSLKILGAHIIGPSASILIHEIISLMYTSDQNAWPILHGMHIHPALSEVVDRAFHSLSAPDQYHHLVEHHWHIME
ncbi:FAD-dependent oxidoreductase, partial [Candidatus Bathyarchaeota archaeon]|nr:FAD-dependent oxidoreductase [Candidatus Bathyarchaeota archaeon]